MSPSPPRDVPLTFNLSPAPSEPVPSSHEQSSWERGRRERSNVQRRRRPATTSTTPRRYIATDTRMSLARYRVGIEDPLHAVVAFSSRPTVYGTCLSPSDWSARVGEEGNGRARQEGAGCWLTVTSFPVCPPAIDVGPPLSGPVLASGRRSP